MWLQFTRNWSFYHEHFLSPDTYSFTCSMLWRPWAHIWSENGVMIICTEVLWYVSKWVMDFIDCISLASLLNKVHLRPALDQRLDIWASRLVSTTKDLLCSEIHYQTSFAATITLLHQILIKPVYKFSNKFKESL